MATKTAFDIETTWSAVESVIEGIAEEYKDSDGLTGEALDEAERRTSKIEGFDSPECQRKLIRMALLNLIYDARHRTNANIKRKFGMYGKQKKQANKPKVISAKSKNVAAAARKSVENALDYRIASRTIGDFYGRELGLLAEKEQRQGEGSLRNATLLRKLEALVPADKKVRQVIKPAKMVQLMKQVGMIGKEIAA